MADHSTITVSKALKAELDADRGEGDTWNGYLRRLHEESGSASTIDRTSGLTEGDLEAIRAVIEDVAVDSDQDDPDSERADRFAIDYDYLREIVREELRRALDDMVR